MPHIFYFLGNNVILNIFNTFDDNSVTIVNNSSFLGVKQINEGVTIPE